MTRSTKHVICINIYERLFKIPINNLYIEYFSQKEVESLLLMVFFFQTSLVTNVPKQWVLMGLIQHVSWPPAKLSWPHQNDSM